MRLPCLIGFRPIRRGRANEAAHLRQRVVLAAPARFRTRSGRKAGTDVLAGALSVPLYVLPLPGRELGSASDDDDRSVASDSSSLIDEIVREGARRMLVEALQAEVSAYI